MAPTTPTASLATRRQLARAERRALRQVPLPGELVDVLGRPQQALGQRGVELGSVGQRDRSAHLGDQLRPQELPLLFESGLQLADAALAERLVRRPGRLVEGPPGGGDGLVHVVVAGIGHRPQDLFGGGIDVVEGLAGLGVDELSVDQHAVLALCRAGHGHLSPSARSPTAYAGCRDEDYRPELPAALATQERTMLIERERVEQIEILTLNRPEAANSLNPPLLAELGAALTRFWPTTPPGPVAPTGAGEKIFCAGMDLSTLGRVGGAG